MSLVGIHQIIQNSMSTQKNEPRQKGDFAFHKENYIIMIIGIALMGLGYLLMMGGRSPDPNEFHPETLYSFRRITLAPILIIAGILAEIVAIFYSPKSSKS